MRNDKLLGHWKPRSDNERRDICVSSTANCTATYTRVCKKNVTRAMDYVRFFKAKYFSKSCETRCKMYRRKKKGKYIGHRALSVSPLLWKCSVIIQWEIRWRFIRRLPMESPRMRVGVAYKRNIAWYTKGNFRRRHVSRGPLFMRRLSRHSKLTSFLRSRYIIFYYGCDDARSSL